eukprot:CAMPEP_0176461740 /NCGR_PEP_ID=MMETSP0127-20121128/34842_1 /TAXON_ID=938130 /ORGANISM="Platyophrya macrostoma, Strain WH" /LENGTH=293 /DNA_ID=CAMNT_0017853505 /DNA_START=30 /DNA_END=911 /DNA_ORIENTATION=+
MQAFQSAKAGGSSFLLNLTQSSRDKIAEEASKHLMEDPDVFEYDKYVDQYQSRREELIEQKKEKEYVAQISSAMDKRKREQTIIQEKLAEKEIQRENAQFGDKERFVTSSYLRMMQENKKFEEEERKKEAYNQAHSINSEDNLGGFYKNLYANDIYAGGHRPDLSKEVQKPQKPEEVKPAAGALNQGQRAPGLPDQQRAKEAPKSDREENLKSKMIEEVDSAAVRAPVDISKGEMKVVRERSRSKSRERYVNPIVEKPEEPVENRVDKAKSAKERYLQRKLQEQAKANPEETK